MNGLSPDTRPVRSAIARRSCEATGHCAKLSFLQSLLIHVPAHFNDPTALSRSRRSRRDVAACRIAAAALQRKKAVARRPAILCQQAGCEHIRCFAVIDRASAAANYDQSRQQEAALDEFMCTRAVESGVHERNTTIERTRRGLGLNTLDELDKYYMRARHIHAQAALQRRLSRPTLDVAASSRELRLLQYTG